MVLRTKRFVKICAKPHSISISSHVFYYRKRVQRKSMDHVILRYKLNWISTLCDRKLFEQFSPTPLQFAVVVSKKVSIHWSYRCLVALVPSLLPCILVFTIFCLWNYNSFFITLNKYCKLIFIFFDLLVSVSSRDFCIVVFSGFLFVAVLISFFCLSIWLSIYFLYS